MVGNKDDMYQFEEVKNNEGIAFAKEINAIYKRTSAKLQHGLGLVHFYAAVDQGLTYVITVGLL